MRSQVDLVIGETSSIAGTVERFDGLPVREFEIAVRDYPYDRKETFYRSAGRWLISELPPGEYLVSARADGALGETTVKLEKGQSVYDVRLELEAPGSVTGRLVAHDTGEPVAGHRIGMYPTPGASFLHHVRGGSQITGADGSFAFERVPPGGFVVSVFSPALIDPGLQEFNPDAPSVYVEAGARVELGDVKLVRRRGRDGDLGFFATSNRRSLRGPYPPSNATVVEVRPRGPAARAGLEVGDVIVSVDGQDVTGRNRHMYRGLTEVSPGHIVELGLESGATMSITAEEKK